MGIEFGYKQAKSSNKFSSDDKVFGPQAEALTGLYGHAGNLYGSQDFAPFQQYANSMTPWMQQQAMMAQPAYQQQLQGGIKNPALDKAYGNFLSSPTATQQWQQAATRGNSFTQPLIDSATQQLQQNYDWNTRPRTNMGAVSAGQSGSSRHGIAEGLQKSQLGMQKAQVAKQIGQQNYWDQLGLEHQIASGLDQNKLDALSQWGGLTQDQNKNQQAGIGFGSNMQNLGMGTLAPMMAGYQLPWQMMGNYANVIGAPTILNSQRGKGNSSSIGVQGGYGA